MLIIPLTSEPSQVISTNFGDTKYTLGLQWAEDPTSDAGGVWLLDITRVADQVVLIRSVPLLIGQDLLAQYALGIGGLAVVDTANTATDSAPDDLGDRIELVWLSDDDLALKGG